MTRIIFSKDLLKKIKEVLKDTCVEKFTIRANSDTKEISLFFDNKESQKKAVEQGTAKASEEIVFSFPELSEKFKSSIKEDSESAIAFLINAFDSDDEVGMKFSSSTKKAEIFCGATTLSVNAEYSSSISGNAYLDKVCENPIISFKKDEFKSQILDKVEGLTVQNEWVNPKVTGVNIIVSTDSAHIFIATKTFHLKSPMTKGTFYPESSKPFIHNKGIIFLKEELIKDIYSYMKEDDEVKFFFNTSCDEEEKLEVFDIFIGNDTVIKMIAVARKKNIVNSEKAEEALSEKSKTEIKVDREKLRKFFIPFSKNPIFMGNVIKVISTSKKGLTIKPFEDGEGDFSFSIEDKEIGSDMEFDINFFVLDAITSRLNGDDVIVKECNSNAKRLIITDGSSWFIAGKSVKQ